ncbi:MAG: hypothetical protein BROFUL_01736 [Candidatus Brocadia fulgida]|uniref:Uncharacterized protein n=1 Tax=Candidatus Brocadia fulgida TaxID=380242 RepID=A0A0M2UVF9_9BACT|nr:MAG: hypothetical protein BROFUL_01736 [Candidatus Brocadia fulgida]
MNEHSPSRTNNDSPANSMNIVDMLNQMGISDPRLQMLAEFMKHQNPPQDKRIPAEEEKIKLKRIIGRYKQLKHENMVLMEKNDALASASARVRTVGGKTWGVKYVMEKVFRVRMSRTQAPSLNMCFRRFANSAYLGGRSKAFRRIQARRRRSMLKVSIRTLTKRRCNYAVFRRR